MSDALHELRPRSAVELYDAALHLCVHTRSELPTLALLGGAPAAASGVWLVWLATHGKPFALAAGLFCAALVFRQVCQGAGARAATRELEGHAEGAWASLGPALARLPSFVVVTVLLALFQAFSVLTLGISFFFSAGHGVGPALIALGSAHGWSFGKVARARLSGRGGAAVALRLLHVLALLFLLGNLHGAVLIGLMLAHSFFSADVSFVARFASPSHAFYDVCLLALAQLLHPVRCATHALLLADARVRHEGFDLLAALRSLREALPGARAALLMLTLGLALLPRSARADEAEDDEGDDPHALQSILESQKPPLPADPEVALRGLAGELAIGGEPVIDRGLDDLQRASPAQRAQLEKLAHRIDAELDRGEDEGARAELRAAFSELGRAQAGAAGSNAVRAHPREAARTILERPEFSSVSQAKADTAPKPSEPPGWWKRFWRWVEDWWKDAQKKHPKDHKDLEAGARWSAPGWPRSSPSGWWGWPR